jgi:hypothetical protein
MIMVYIISGKFFHWIKSHHPLSFMFRLTTGTSYMSMVQWFHSVPARSDVYNWNYETVDIAPYLQQGSNVLASVVWNFGEERQEAQISWQTAFILQGNSEKEKIVNTNSSWLCIKDSAYNSLQPQLIYTYYAAGPTEKIDFNFYPEGWSEAGYNDAAWKPAQQLSNGLPKGVFFWTLGLDAYTPFYSANGNN